MKSIVKRICAGLKNPPALVLLSIFMTCSLAYAEAKKIPPLDAVIRIVLKSEKVRATQAEQETVFLAKQYYYQILSKDEQLSISEEVKRHFEKAISKAEEVFAEGNDEVSQSDITKLRLGLAGANNDIAELKSEVEQATLSLENLMGWNHDPNVKMTEDKILPVEFNFSSFEDYRKNLQLKTGNATDKSSAKKKPNNPGAIIDKDKALAMQKSFIRVREAREKLRLAVDTKKMTRAMLVTEVANHDFGIGNSGNLFEALIIYTRVLRGYYDSIYNFNIAVADLDKKASPRLIF